VNYHATWRGLISLVSRDPVGATGSNMVNCLPTATEGVSVGLEMGLWRVDENPVRLVPTMMPLESRLEELIQQDSTLLGTEVMIIGRQVPTDFGKFIDLLAVDSDGTLHVIELKRDKTPRDVVAQLLDYGSWVQGLDGSDIRSIYRVLDSSQEFDTAFAGRFGDAPPDELNADQVLTIVASSIDSSSERIVTYLNSSYGVPINVVFFHYFSDSGHSYLARTWLVNEAAAAASVVATSRKKRQAASWNGVDWYVSFGEEANGRQWNDARRFGFVSAGGGEWYSRTLLKLPLGGRVFVCIPKRGYVGVGTVSGPARRADEAFLEVGGETRKFLDLKLEGHYLREDSAVEFAEYIVPVVWDQTRSSADALWKQGMFANQNSACRLSSQFTIDEVSKGFALPGE
jgi:hypothetical protein